MQLEIKEETMVVKDLRDYKDFKGPILNVLLPPTI